jgi:hypothetical protein
MVTIGASQTLTSMDVAPPTGASVKHTKDPKYYGNPTK